MTEMKWCRREKTLLKIGEKILMGALVLIATGMVITSVIGLLGFLTGIIPESEFQPGSLLALAVVLGSTTIVAFAPFGAIITSDPPFNRIRWSIPFLVLGVVFSALVSATEIMKFEPSFGYVIIIGTLIYLPFISVHIKCMKEHYAKLLEQLGHEPTEAEATEYMKKVEAAKDSTLTT